MNDHLISLFIDNELTLHEKIDFIEAVADNKQFSDTARDLLRQELTLGTALADLHSVSNVIQPQPERVKRRWLLRPASFVGGFVLACCLAALFPFVRYPTVPAVSGDETYRFVLYLPDAGEASVIGTFSNWSPIPMEKVGNSGYWTLKMQLPPGEYRYSYLIEQHTRIYDPTVLDRETDDYGGENSILNIAGLINDDQTSS
ncbi:glycogen-binding domain-containing protein [Desulfopila aestuarii]|uniref:Glycogen recognition site of AMP-activated protein kinase n=1 Tax=Desulfopila aestuarii DSM 18488 TaxID=1121416 RepID=A0A1M7XWI7_9BACT|nr:glycogen-binding domain-containing protein [Desulfopila aestuarii]SHO43110.1 Glycogen recognition site of AMP-activated protein kinase [Desulfopila aestuarii DSM 18488]